jgi:hypothetical protein
MLWGQQLKACIDHKNLMQDALGLTSDRVYCWRLLLEEYGPHHHVYQRDPQHSCGCHLTFGLRSHHK